MMNCPKCGSNNVSIEFIEKGSKTKKHGNGLGGHINNTARAVTAMSTLGLSNLVWKKSKGTEKSKNKHKKIGICQSCGYDWKI